MTASQNTQGRAKSAPKRVGPDRLLNASVRMLVFAGILVAAGQVLGLTSLGKVTPADNLVLWLSVIVAGAGGAWILAQVMVRSVMASVQSRAKRSEKTSGSPAVHSGTGPKTYNYHMPEW